MSVRIKHILVLIVLLCSYFPTFGQSRTQRFVLYYLQNGIEIDENYLDNKEQIDRIRKYLLISPKIDSITITSYASPEGPFKRNKWLAGKRAEAARKFLMENLPEGTDMTEDKIRLNPVAENWNGLLEEAEDGYYRENRDEVLSILKSDMLTDAKKQAIRDLDGGKSWWYLIRHHMDRLRMATWICVWVDPKAPILHSLGSGEAEIMNSQTGLAVQSLSAEPVMAEIESVKSKRTFMALKTNLLYDAATAVNFSVEVPVNEKFSLQYEHVCPWWTAGPNGNKYSMQILSMGGEARWWFRPKTRPASDRRIQRDALMGHYLGLYADGGKFDVQVGDNFGCRQSYFKGVGLSYGYSLPVCKRLNMEFSVSLGYMMIDYQHYNPLSDWSMLIRDHNKAGRMHYFGPTKIKVSLVVPLLMNVRKGGNR